MARDDFSKEVIRQLQGRVGNRCSNPACRVPTCGPQKGSNKTASIGVAAHIAAASHGGPRYSDSMSADERKSFDNGIWLCQTCSVKIDRDVERYDVALLKRWKDSAEAAAALEQGKKLPNSSDAMEFVSMALTGHPKKMLANAIENIHLASSSAIEALDPRFKVISSYINNTTCYEVHARETVSVTMVVSPAYAAEYLDKYSRLLERGEDLEISSQAISFTGSKLFEELTSEEFASGTFRMSASKKTAIIKLWVKASQSDVPEYFDDVMGEISLGNKEFSFAGHACGRLVEVTLRKSICDDDAGIFGFTVNFSGWDGKDVRHLPYFPKIHSFVSKLVAGEQLFCALEIDGLRVMISNGLNLNQLDSIQYLDYQLQYTKAAQVIAVFLGRGIGFKPEIKLTVENFRALLEVVKIVEGKATYSREHLNTNPSFNLTVKDGNLNYLEDTTAPVVIQYVEQEPFELEIFGDMVQMPPRTSIIEAVTPKITSIVEATNEEKIVSVELMLTDKSRIQTLFPQNVG